MQTFFIMQKSLGAHAKTAVTLLFYTVGKFKVLNKCGTFPEEYQAIIGIHYFDVMVRLQAHTFEDVKITMWPR